jgi:flavin reductase (DIM6/NTAB) family NADH-FMN oxidoreductase RutF
MAMSWHMMIDFEPPLVGCVVSNRNHSFLALKATKECAINIPTADLAAAVVGAGNTSGRRLDKFKAFGLTPVPASQIGPPLIEECYANLECRVIDTRLVRRYNLFLLEVVRAWHARSVKRPRTIHHLGSGRFMLAGRRITLPSRMR